MCGRQHNYSCHNPEDHKEVLLISAVKLEAIDCITLALGKNPPHPHRLCQRKCLIWGICCCSS